MDFPCDFHGFSRYADGGAVAAFVTALSEAYATLEQGEMPSSALGGLTGGSGRNSKNNG